MTAVPEFDRDVPLFAATLKARTKDKHAAPRTLLREAFLAMREKAAELVTFIRRDIPDLTVHDVSHLDALWKMASMIAGKDYPLTPAEAFVLGGAILLHDAAMSLAPYPEGLAGLKGSVEWKDTIAQLAGAQLASSGVAEDEIERRAIPQVLRVSHAKQAEVIATAAWRATGGSEYLINDGELRHDYGRLIGKIAHSHWMGVSQLERELGGEIGASRKLPDDWTVDPVKVACLLRVADAAHLSPERAPRFTMALTRPDGEAERHWNFQTKLAKPRAEGDRLIYTTKATPFALADADAWWQCHQSLTMVGDELRSVDILLSDTRRPPLAVKEVAGLRTPEELAKLVRVEGWTPVDARVTVSDVPALVRTLGGEQLYGNDNTVPIRELLQNACDAIRARRLLQDKGEKWGTITVRFIETDEGTWLEVLDDGIGMSRRVLTGPLLDFGKSFWRSPLAAEELPGLAAKLAEKGLEQTGQFGIGFYSVFMLGDRVTVTSRLYRDGLDGTQTLEFRSGVGLRPILRKPTDDEQLQEPGTRVRVLLHKKPTEEGGILWIDKRWDDWERPLTAVPEILLAHIAPAIDANLVYVGATGPSICVEANDWLNIDGHLLLQRASCGHLPPSRQHHNFMIEMKDCVLPLYDMFHTPIGRVTIGSSRHYIANFTNNIQHREELSLCIGGLRSTYSFGYMWGIAQCKGASVSRMTACLDSSSINLSQWLTAQAMKLLTKSIFTPKELMQYAHEIYSNGGDVLQLPLCWRHGKPFKLDDIADLLQDSQKISSIFGQMDAQRRSKRNEFLYFLSHPTSLRFANSTEEFVAAGGALSKLLYENIKKIWINFSIICKCINNENTLIITYERRLPPPGDEAEGSEEA